MPEPIDGEFTFHFDEIVDVQFQVPGLPGLQGETGPGVPPAGAAGQFLQKFGPDDFDTRWTDVNLTTLGAEAAGAAAAAEAAAVATSTAYADAADNAHSTADRLYSDEVADAAETAAKAYADAQDEAHDELLGTAAYQDTTAFATFAQGVKADTASQPGHGHDLSDISDAGTAAALDVPPAGDANVSQVVKGDDSRLSDSRNPVAHSHTESDISDFGDYSPTTHNHDADYAATAHNHDADYAATAHNHDADYAAAAHDHDADYAAAAHDHNADYAATAHNHDANYEAAGAVAAHEDTHAPADAITAADHSLIDHTGLPGVGASGGGDHSDSDHADAFSPLGHTHTGTDDHTHAAYSPTNHDHGDTYSPVDHGHTGTDDHSHSAYVAKSGDTMSGDLTLSGAPTNALHAATKQYVDDNAGGGGGATSLDDLTDVNAPTPNNGNVLGYVAGASEWVGAPVSAVKSYGNGDALNLWDNDLGTNWHISAPIQSTNTADFGAPITVNKVTIYADNGASTVTLEYSDDDSAWTALPGITSQTISANTSEEFTFSSETHRYWRLTINGTYSYLNVVLAGAVSEWAPVSVGVATVARTELGNYDFSSSSSGSSYAAKGFAVDCTEDVTVIGMSLPGNSPSGLQMKGMIVQTTGDEGTISSIVATTETVAFTAAGTPAFVYAVFPSPVVLSQGQRYTFLSVVTNQGDTFPYNVPFPGELTGALFMAGDPFDVEGSIITQRVASADPQVGAALDSSGGTSGGIPLILFYAINDSLPEGPPGPSYGGVPSFTYAGTPSPGTGVNGWYNDFGVAHNIASIRLSAGTAPSSGTISIDVKVDGSSVLASALVLADGTGTIKTTTIDTPAVAVDSKITVDITENSGSAADITVQIGVEAA